MDEMELIPNCSEATFRVDVSDLSKKEIEQIKEIWEHHVEEYMEENEYKDERPEGSILEESRILGKKVLACDGDFPYNASSEIKHIISVAEKGLGKKLVWESENR